MKWRLDAGALFDIGTKLAGILPIVDRVYHRIAGGEAVVVEDKQLMVKGNRRFKGNGFSISTEELTTECRDKVFWELQRVLAHSYEVVRDDGAIHIEYMGEK